MDSGYAEMMHEIDVLEYRLNQHYRQAEKELQEKINKFYKDFDRLDQKKREQVAKGEITDAEYKTWRQNKIMSGKVWEQRKDVISRDLYNTNYMARNMVYDELPDVYASAHNFATYQVESGAHVDTSYVLYNRESVERLIADNPDLLPYQKINYALDTSWNKKNLQSVMIQGILQGESIPHLAKRLSKTVTQKNRAAAIRNARTMATSAYNGGKMDAFKRAKALGIDMKVRWRATFDNRTRDSHRALDGETVEVGQAFSNGLTFPCDMSFLNNLKNGGEKVINFSKGCRETYNCRCTIQGVSGRLESRAIKYRSNAAVGISYEDWKKGHKYADDVRAGKIKPYEPPKPPVKAVNDMITHKKGEHSAVYDLFEKARNNRAINKGKIAHNPVKALKEKLSFDKIVERVGGGDDTQGSCSSLAYAYIANKMGYDVLDFRGGSSRKFFSYDVITKIVNQLEGVKTQIFKVRNEVTETAETLRKLNLPLDKEYRLSVGRHAAIIRNTKDGYEYLELQSAVKNGWHSFELKDKYHYDYDRETKQLKITVEQTPATMEEVLEDRFGCYRGSFLVRDMELTEVDSYNNDEFLDIMGYINTKENKQHKSVNGHER